MESFRRGVSARNGLFRPWEKESENDEQEKLPILNLYSVNYHQGLENATVHFSRGWKKQIEKEISDTLPRSSYFMRKLSLLNCNEGISNEVCLQSTSFFSSPAEPLWWLSSNSKPKNPVVLNLSVAKDSHSLQRRDDFSSSCPISRKASSSSCKSRGARKLCSKRSKRFNCIHCQSNFSNNGQLRGHLRIHTGERPFVCPHPHCVKTFTRNEELTRHKKIHTGIRPFSCIVCGKKFGRKDHLKKHSKIHQKRDPLPQSHDLSSFGTASLASSSCYQCQME